MPLPELLAVTMVVALCALLMAGYPVALTLGGMSLAFALLGAYVFVPDAWAAWREARTSASSVPRQATPPAPADTYRLPGPVVDLRNAVLRRPGRDGAAAEAFAVGETE